MTISYHLHKINIYTSFKEYFDTNNFIFNISIHWPSLFPGESIRGLDLIGSISESD